MIKQPKKMNKEFIQYEQALELKELGFDEPNYFLKWYDSKGDIREGLGLGEVKAPLYQQAFRWFREKYGLAHNIHPITYDCYVVNQKDPSIDDIGDFNTYEQAELACLKKLIEIVKQPKKD